MRVTGKMMTNNLLKNLSDSRDRLDEYNRQLSTGKKFDMPSQDPTGVSRSMKLESTINNNQQYVDNIDQAKTWSEVTSSALKDTTQILQRTRELATYGANGSLSDNDKKAIADEVTELKSNLAEIANKSHNGKFIFSGHKTLTKPYPTAGSAYQGGNGKISREISSGVEMNINVNGDFFEDVLTRMQDFIGDLNAGNTNSIANQRIGDMEQSIDEVLKLRSEVGAKQNRLEMTKSRLEEDKIKLKKLLSKNEDVDIAETIMNLKMSENVHRAALSSGARIIQPTLVQFLQ